MITKEPESNAFVQKQMFFDSARSAFRFLIENIMSENETMLMPAYIGQSAREGSGVFDPVRETHTKYDFYKINSDLSVDIDDLAKKIKHTHPKAVLVIHYFGFPQKGIFDIKALCKQNNVVLIEDCAHSLQSMFNGHKLGTIGDYSFNSVHKLIATPDGGILNINVAAELPDNNNKMAYDTLQTYVKTDIDATSALRIENYLRYTRLLKKSGNKYDIMFPELMPGIVPLNFPILIKNVRREDYYFELISRGIITVSLYYKMIDELDCNIYHVSFDISNRILNLPVHQDITANDIDAIVNEIKHMENE